MSDIDCEATICDIYFTTQEMKRIFSDRNRVQKQMDCEAALAETEAELGIIPQAAAEEIVRKSKVEYLDFAQLKEAMVRTGHPLIPLIQAYKSICAEDAGEYVHWGATTQDMMDTAVVLQLREAYSVLMDGFDRLYRVLAEQAWRYKDQVMVGRTNGQHAMPITLGYKLSVWGFEVRDNIDRLREAERRVFKGEFAGAVGTLASLGEQGLRVQQGFLMRLGLQVPPVAWSSSRNHYAEMVNDLAIMAATMGKIGTEVYALQKSEIGEVEEPQRENAVGSSTMPHKRNPFRAMELSTNAKLARGCAAVMMESLETEHERDPRSACVENALFVQIFSLLHASVERAIFIMQGLVVNPKHMQRSLEALHGLIFSEALMMALGRRLGRQSAHEILHELSMQAFAQEIPLAELLKADGRVNQVLTAQEIDAIMRPEGYVGQAPFFAAQLKRQADAYFAAKK